MMSKLKLNMSIAPMLEDKLAKVIEEGLKEVVHHRPEDPVKFLGKFFLEKAEQQKKKG